LALGMGRLLVEQGLPAFGADLPVPDAIEDVSGTSVAQLSDAACRLLLAVALNADLLRSELSAIETPGAVEDAVSAGLLRLDGEHVRAAHPLLALAVKQRSSPSVRRALHSVLADAVADRERRALVLALAAVGPDARLATTVAAAAAAPARRLDAVRLAEHLALAGEPQRLRELLMPELGSLPAGALRARAWLLLAEPSCQASRGPVWDWDHCEALVDAALVECADDPAIRASVLVRRAGHAVSTMRIAEAETLAREALSAACRGAPNERRSAPYQLAWVRALRGLPVDALVAERPAATTGACHLAWSAECVFAARLAWRGDVRRAYELLARWLALADERGELFSHVLLRAQLCDVALRAGAWSTASHLLDEWAGSSDGELLPFPVYERSRALLSAGA